MTATLPPVAEPIQPRARLEHLGHAYAQQRAVTDNLRDQLADAVRAAVDSGVSEVEAARLAGVSRMTVRSWLGKGGPKYAPSGLDEFKGDQP